MAQKFIMTQQGLDDLKKRLDELKEEQKQNLIDIQDARSQGDLSENADYAAARERQGKIAGEMAEIENKIKNAEVTTVDGSNNFGKYVTIKFLDMSDMDEEEYQIVGSVEANPIEGKISNTSPLGQAVCEASKGDIKEVRTETGDRFKVEVKKISDKPSKKA